MKKVNLWTRVSKELTLCLNPLNSNNFIKRNIKQFYLPIILAAFLFSCKKEKNELTPEKSLGTEQVISESCGTTDYLKQQLITDPDLKSRMDAIEKGMALQLGDNKTVQRLSSTVITIPVVVHVVYNLPEQNISDAQIQSQIDVLTEDFTKTNADIINVPAAFQSAAANANIQFVLAKRDPNGNATNGITRTYSSITSFSSNNYVKFASYGGHDAWPTDQYLNIWVCNLGLCGYATYPGTSPSVDGVVVKYNCFGRTGTLQTNYNKGRTTTHEVSHWLNVYHIWGDATCGDDLVGDTPSQEKANYDHPAFPLMSSCSINSNGDMFMNYLDYTADDVRSMMTQGQANRINATLSGPRASLLTSLGAISPSGSICNVPGGLNSTLITSNGCSLNWTSSGATSYNVRYKPTASTTWITISSTSTSLNLNNLTASTNYEYQVASVCSGGVTSAFSTSSAFTTLANTIVACNTPSGLIATLITKSSATLNWSSTGAANYNVRYKSTSSTVWINATTSSTSLSVSGLSSSTNYEFEIASECSSTNLSAYSISALFATSAAKRARV
jgi:hypothetical protein